MVKKVVTGSYAASYAAKLARAEVVAAYPITPQTAVVELIAEFVARGEMKAQFIKVESEHSAMAACIAASNTGARAFTATSSHGLLLMHELLHWASAARTPVVLVNVNRALGPPWSVWADHSDSMSQRDTGWIQFYAESSQEVLDTTIMAFKIGESRDVLLPVMVTQDAFYLSHTYEIVDIPDQEKVDDFLPPYDPPYKLDIDEPHGFGSLSMPHHWYMELRYLIKEGMENARKKIIDVEREYYEMFGRRYGGLLDTYKCDDAEVILICVGTAASTARVVIDEMRKDGKKVGLARIRAFRPFPAVEIRKACGKANVIAVLDRCYTFGDGGALYTEVRAALYNVKNRPLIKNYIAGIGGRDITPKVLKMIFEDCYNIKEKGLDEETVWMELKRPEGE